MGFFIDWECDAYGTELEGLCFFEDRGLACGSREMCLKRMAHRRADSAPALGRVAPPVDNRPGPLSRPPV